MIFHVTTKSISKSNSGYKSFKIEIALKIKQKQQKLLKIIK